MLRLKILIWLMGIQLKRTIKRRDSLVASGEDSLFIKGYNTVIKNYESTILFLNTQKQINEKRASKSI